ncbi:MAG: hypothetical protein ACKVOU_09250 [Cytophagales bacterium]
MKNSLENIFVTSKTKKESFHQEIKEFHENPELYSKSISREELYARFPKIAPVKKQN